MPEPKTRAEITTAIHRLCGEMLDADPGTLTDATSFADDLGADSLDNIEFVMAVEEEFDLELPDAEAEAIKTVGDAVSLIEKKLAA